MLAGFGGWAMIGVMAACASITRAHYQPPVVTVREVRVNGLGPTGGSLDVVLEVYNPNHFALDASRITYTLLVDTVTLGEGASDARLVVGRRDSAQVRLPLSFTWNGVGAAGRALLATGAVPYHVIGAITVGSAVGTFTLPYDRSGSVAAFGGPRE